MKILVVDDQAYNRDLLSFILVDEGHDIVEAENGRHALETYEIDADIDLILMDVNMPEMDGISATKAVRETEGDHHALIIFVTALDDPDVLEKCLEAGGDDFIPKPISETVLVAKVNAHRRTQVLHNNLRSANESLNFHRNMMDREHAIVERIFAKGMDKISTECVNVEKYTSPASMFDGDLVLASPSPSGGVYILIGDFTGHGLAASIGSLPVTEIFYNQAARQSSISQIAVEINTRLHELLPTNMFFCATLLYMDNAADKVMVWSGGMNDLYYLPPNSKEVHTIEGAHMPMAILSPEEFDERPTMLELEKGTQVYIFTDGVNEAKNSADEEFGLERVQEILIQYEDKALDMLTKAVHEFTKGAEQSDDMSLMKLLVGPVKHISKESGELVDVREKLHDTKSFSWDFKMRLEGEELKNTNIVNQILGFVSSIQGIELHQDKIFTIVSELYSNALEHGVLGLKSSLKESADGFEEYYRQRATGLENIDGQYIDVDFSFIKGNPNQVKLIISDSGQGFDYESVKKGLSVNEGSDENDEAHGRGVGLLENLCSSLEYSNEGRTVIAAYDLRHHH